MSRSRRRAKPAPSRIVAWIDRTDNELERAFVGLLGALGIAALAVPQYAAPVIAVIVALITVRSARGRLI